MTTTAVEPRPRWSERFIEAVDGTKLYVREKASHAPLAAVLCDGIACDGFIWRHLANDLLPATSVVHWNYRGHGRSGKPVDPERVDMSVFVDDLAVVRQPITRPTVLIGHSMGCQLALESYRSQPEQLCGLILICGAAGRVTHTFKGGEGLALTLPKLIDRVRDRPRFARALWNGVSPEMAARVALAVGEVDARVVLPEDLVRYTEHVAGLDLLMFLRMLHAIGEQTAEGMLGTVGVPVLIIAGDRDTFTPPHLAKQLAARLPHSELLLVEGATHVVPLERRALVRDRILAFLHDRVLPGLY